MSENGTKYSKIKISVDGERQKSNPHSILFHGPFSMLSLGGLHQRNVCGEEKFGKLADVTDRKNPPQRGKKR
jgi:hypothetical protein